MTNQKLELTWLGKGEQPRLEPRLLLLEPEHCHGDPNAENILIHGDNLLALKALEQQYAGKVKCIYIDPPYNTGNAFEHYDDMQEHSVWLNLMYQRLLLLRKLLSNEGSIWVTLDDNEVHYCKVMMDEIFGRQNFVGTVIWEKTDSPRMDAVYFSGRHDTILVFSKNKSLFNLKKIDDEETPEHYARVDENGRMYYTKPLRAMGGQGDSREARPTLYYEIIAPDGQSIFPKKQDGTDGAWRWKKDKVDAEKSRIDWVKGKNGWTPYYRIYADNRVSRPAETIWTHSDVGSNRTSKAEMKALFLDEKSFATPKPERLIERIITLTTDPNDLVLDSFLGSGTTAAVAHKMNRRWIGIELGEHCYTHCVPRLRKVVSGEDQGGISKAMDWKGGGGFKTYRLAPSLLAADEHAMLRFNPDFTDDMVAEAVAKIEGFTYAPDPAVFWKQSRSSEQDYLLVAKIFVTAEWLAQLHEQMAEGESLLLCCPAYGEGCERAFPNITLKKIPQAFMRKYEFGKDDYSLNVQNVIGGSEEVAFLDEDFEGDDALPQAPTGNKRKKPTDTQPTLF